MPELPDLEVFASNLDKTLTRRKIKKVTVMNNRNINVPVKTLQSAVEGATVRVVRREGKEIAIELANGHVIQLHMMLKGKLVLFETKNDAKSTLVELTFDKGPGLALTDQLKRAKLALDPPASSVPDALSKEFTSAYLVARLGKYRGNVKALLLDQKIVRGIGNAYADEILYQAGISPFSSASKIPADKVKLLSTSITKVLKAAVKKIRKINPDIVGGEERSFLVVHTRERDKTPAGEAILKDEGKGRKTYYTASQKLYE